MDLISNVLHKDIDIPNEKEIDSENEMDFEVFEYHQVYPPKNIRQEKIEQPKKKNREKNKQKYKTKLKLLSESDISQPIQEREEL